MRALLFAIFLGCGVDGALADGDAALARGDLVAAEARYRDALARSPDRPEGLYGLGWTLHLAGRADLARAAFQRCVDVHPDSPLGYKGLGSVAMGEGNVALARRRFTEALARAPGDVPIRHSLALLELRGGDAEAAVTAFRALSSEAPDRGELQQGLAEALLAASRHDEALAAAEAAVTRAATPRARALALVTRARVLVRTSAGRVRPEDCAATAAPVRVWLDAADRALDEAEASGILVPEVPEARRAVRRQRSAVDDACGPAAPVGSDATGG
jgi:predicted Zn-dependent protease